MTDDIFKEPDDANTPLTEEEKEGSIPSYTLTRAELNQAEQRNIMKAELWSQSKKRNPLDVTFLKNSHKRMYNEVWEWAGKFRKSERNIGIDAYSISSELAQLVSDIQYQVDHNSFPLDKITARFHPEARLNTSVTKRKWPT